MEGYVGAEEYWTKIFIMNTAPSLALLTLFAVQFVLLVSCPSFIEKPTEQTYFHKQD